MADTFVGLEQEYKTCMKCPALCETRTQVVFGSGNPESKILLIGEAPGATEDKKGIPFCGMSGKILTQLLESVGLSRDDIFITNTIICRPPNNRNPSKDEIANCRERLDRLLQVMQPKVIVTIGNFATDRIIGRTGIKSIHGQEFPTTIAGQEVIVVPVVHPASYLYSGRNPEIFQSMQADFQTIADIVDAKKKQTSLADF